MEIRLFHGTPRKALQGPAHGNPVVTTWLICEDGCPGVSSVPALCPAMEKSNRGLSKAKAKARVQSLCFSLELSPFPACSRCCVEVCRLPPRARVWSPYGRWLAAWQQRPQGYGARRCERRSQVEGGRETRRVSTSLSPWDYISLGLGWSRCYSNIQSTSQAFSGFLMGPPPTPTPANPLFPRLN